MLTLTLFRHAKSSWDFPELEDFDRPLASRGQKAAPKVARFLAERELVPDFIYCSAAQRTRETLDLALPCWPARPEVDHAHALYMATVPTFLAMARDAPEGASHVMIVGHNPGLEEFALSLVGSGDKKARQAMARKFPTAAAAVLTFEVDRWADIEPATGHLALFVTPKMLD